MTDSFSAPKKFLGQNFLQDQNIIRKIIASLNIQPGDTIVEIGPGRGALTEHLLQQTDKLHIIEFDYLLVEYWQAQTKANLTVHAQDVLKFDFGSFLQEQQRQQQDRPIKIIGNLPYNISSPVLFTLLPFAEQIDSQVVMLQKEVVERMSAQPNNKQYGRLSVMLQQRYLIEHLFNVPPTAFFPPPKVDSAIARLTLLPAKQTSLNNHQIFTKVVKQAFSQRRKTLRNTLKGLLTSDQISALQIDPGARAETLSVEDFIKLANAVSDQAKSV